MAIEAKIKLTFEKAFEVLGTVRDILISAKINQHQNPTYSSEMIDLPLGFINEYIDVLAVLLKNHAFNLRTVEGVNQRLGNITRNFDNPIFQTPEKAKIDGLISQLMDCRRELDDLKIKLDTKL